MTILVNLLILTTLASSALCAVNKVHWTRMYVRWHHSGHYAYVAKKGFLAIPMNITEAENDKWELARYEKHTILWCLPNDPRVCAVFDRRGNIAGLQISIPQEDLVTTPYEWRNHSFFIEDTIFCKKVAGGRFYLVPQDVLEAGGRTEVDELGSSLWLQRGDSFVHVPSNGTQLKPQGWSLEGCIASMGRHYYYNTSSDMDCQNFEPYFLLLDQPNYWLHGVGFQTFGVKSWETREWFEDIKMDDYKKYFLSQPKCVFDWASTYGLLSLHVFFVHYPYGTLCV